MVMIRGRRGTRTHQGAPPTTGHLIQRAHRLGRALLTPGPLYHMVTLRLTKAQVKKQKKKTRDSFRNHGCPIIRSIM